MIGQFPHGIDLHPQPEVGFSKQAHIIIITTKSFITNYNLKNDDRVTYIDFGELQQLSTVDSVLEQLPKYCAGTRD